MGNDIVVGLGSVDGSAGKGSENRSVKGLVSRARGSVGVGVGDGVGRVVGDGGDGAGGT